MRLIDADALSAFVGDLRSTLHKEQSTFRAMTEIEFNTRDYMLLNFQQTIDNAPTVKACFTTKDLEDAFIKGKESGKKERPQGEWIPVKEAIEKLTNLLNAYEYAQKTNTQVMVELNGMETEALDLAIKAIRIVDIIEACFKRDSNLMMDYDDWADVKEEANNDT